MRYGGVAQRVGHDRLGVEPSRDYGADEGLANTRGTAKLRAAREGNKPRECLGGSASM